MVLVALPMSINLPWLKKANLFTKISINGQATKKNFFFLLC